MSENDEGRPAGAPRSLPQLSPPTVAAARDGVIYEARMILSLAAGLYDAIGNCDYETAIGDAENVEDRLEGLVAVLERAALALDLLPHLEEEARERQAHGQTAPGRTLSPETDEAFGRADEKAADLVGVGRTTVANAKAIQKIGFRALRVLRCGNCGAEFADVSIKSADVSARDCPYCLLRDLRPVCVDIFDLTKLHAPSPRPTPEPEPESRPLTREEWEPIRRDLIERGLLTEEGDLAA